MSSGERWYQTVNFIATGVEWHNDIGAFGFDMKNRKRCATWFFDILEEIENEIDVRLKLENATTWINVPNEVRHEIELAIG
ncbi:hypothetical protein [Pseudoduganella sp. RAF53_2]|uniref:hypothetical protein n=1 Tax=unclassified Pseudoduganella TaxID=2637179 RepID=UPI003F9BF208